MVNDERVSKNCAPHGKRRLGFSLLNKPEKGKEENRPFCRYRMTTKELRGGSEERGCRAASLTEKKKKKERNPFLNLTS